MKCTVDSSAVRDCHRTAGCRRSSLSVPRVRRVHVASAVSSSSSSSISRVRSRDMAAPFDDADRFGGERLLGSLVSAVSVDGRYGSFSGMPVAWEGEEAGFVVAKQNTNEIVHGVHAAEMSYIRRCVDQATKEDSNVPIVLGAVRARHSQKSDSDEPIALKTQRPPARGYVGISVRDHPSSICPYQISCSVFGSRFNIGKFQTQQQAARAYDYVITNLAQNGAGRAPLNFSGALCMPREERAQATECLERIRGTLREQKAAKAESSEKVSLVQALVTRTKYVGVDEVCKLGESRYRARLYVAGQRVLLGFYITPLEAAMVHDYAARRVGQRMRLNFPSCFNLHLDASTMQFVNDALSALTPSHAVPANDVKHASLAEVCREFRSLSDSGPLFVCTTCRRTWFSHSVRVLPENTRTVIGASHAAAWLSGRRSVDDKEWICKTCLAYVSKKKCPPFAPCRKPDIPELPNALAGFSSMENDLIALRLPFMKLRGLPPSVAGGPRKLGQLALKGMVVNVPANLSHVQLALPRFIDCEGTVPVTIKYKLRHQACYKAAKNVRPARLRDALQYLVEHPTLWREAGVSVRSDWLGEKQEERSVITPAERARIGLEGGVPCSCMDSSSDSDSEDCEEVAVDAKHGRLPPDETMIHDIPSFLISHELGVNVAPCEGQTPVGVLQDPVLEEKAFPCLFGGQRRPTSELTFAQTVKFELMNFDRRFARYPSNIFFKFRKLQTIAVHRLSWVRLRKSKLAGRGIPTAGELRNPKTRSTLMLQNIGFRDFKTLRGSPDYDREGKREAFGMIRQLGPFQIFANFTMAETHWAALLQVLHQLA